MLGLYKSTKDLIVKKLHIIVKQIKSIQMTTLFNTIEELKKALTITENNTDVLSYHDERDIKRGINAAIDALNILNKPPQLYVPHLNEFIEDKQFYIWEIEERIDCSFAMSMTNWTEVYAQSILDELEFVKALHHRAEGASYENDALIREAAELVLSKYEYISNTTVN
jgi:hypothetical protein